MVSHKLGISFHLFKMTRPRGKIIPLAMLCVWLIRAFHSDYHAYIKFRLPVSSGFVIYIVADIDGNFRLPEANIILLPGYKMHLTTQKIEIKNDLPLVSVIAKAFYPLLLMVSHKLGISFRLRLSSFRVAASWQDYFTCYALPLTRVNLAFGSDYLIYWLRLPA